MFLTLHFEFELARCFMSSILRFGLLAHCDFEGLLERDGPAFDSRLCVEGAVAAMVGVADCGQRNVHRPVPVQREPVHCHQLQS